MSAMSRTKGQTGEREIAGIARELTGWDVRRRVRQHADCWRGVEWTADTTVQAWAAVARELITLKDTDV